MIRELSEYLESPHSPIKNFALGRWYETQGHDCPAVSFYLRVAEFAEEFELQRDDDEGLFLLPYEALLRAHFCIDRQKTRELTAKSLLQRAIAFAPHRPEAYYLLTKFEQSRGNWQEVYMLSCIGHELDATPPLSTNTGYTGPHSFLLPRALSAHQWGRGTEARLILQELVDNHRSTLSPQDTKLVVNKLKTWGVGEKDIADVPYFAGRDMSRLKWYFDGLEEIERNFSQAYQDMFVLTVLNGKKNGTYLEIGSEEPYYKSNTALLEKVFGWKGISVEIDQAEVDMFKSQRSNPVICADATKVDYSALLEKANFPTDLDYLQIDTEPSSTSFEVLLTIPFEKYRFAIITFEHDHAVDFSRTYRDKSRRYLWSLGYKLIVPDVGPTDWYSFEDWWVHPELVNMEDLVEMGMVVKELPGLGKATNVSEYFLQSNPPQV